MRCTRCGGLAKPQAVGRNLVGDVVFGWCRKCLAEECCVEMELARPWKLGAVGFGDWLGAEPQYRAMSGRTTPTMGPLPEYDSPLQPGIPDRALLRSRGKVLRILALVLSLWGASLVLAVAWLVLFERSPGDRLPRYLFLGIGGAFATLVALAFAVAELDATSRRRLSLRFTQIGGVVAALLILLFGILRHDPKRDPWIAGLAIALFLASMLAARRLAPPASEVV